MDDENKIIDMSDCTDEDYKAWNNSVKDWKQSGEGVHTLADSVYNENMRYMRENGFYIGVLVSGITACVTVTAWPYIKRIGSKIKDKFKK